MTPAIESEYRVEITEHTGVPWTCGTYTGRKAAWKRVRMAARNISSTWEFPVWVRVYEVRPAIICRDCGTVQDEWQREHDKDCRCGGPFETSAIEKLIFSCDLTQIQK